MRILNLFFSIAVAMVLLGDAIGATNSTELAAAPSRQCRATTPVPLEPGLLRRTGDAVGDSDCWVESICAAVKAFSQEEYNSFVRLLRQESAPRGRKEEAARPPRAQHFDLYTSASNRLRAYQCLEAGAERAPADIQFELFSIMRSSVRIPPTNPYRWLKTAVEGGDAWAQNEMSRQTILWFGRPDTPPQVAVYSNSASYVKLLEHAAQAGVPNAQLRLARYYLGGSEKFWGTRESNPSQAVHWYERAVQHREDQDTFEPALLELGGLYFLGRHVSQDYHTAFRWYSLVDVTNAHACSPLSSVRAALIKMYREGLGVERDIAKAEALQKRHTPCT